MVSQRNKARVEEESSVRGDPLTKRVVSECKDDAGKGEWSRCFQAS